MAELRVVWQPRAWQSFVRTLQHLSAQDAMAAELVARRVEEALAVLATRPDIGTLTLAPGRRSFPVPRTGHTIDYRVVRDELRISRWARQTRHRPG
ncbi:type II toxin-antitoxin system RelE/ParE family toxin [Duganella sp. FT3S]|uniref:Type II toxin-antitoxin system RelE/ParE family toxin n=1 Tax=Rugamonas fusca TaxID=2758568 RepID=A0A7W2I6S4_9BURK|nr:type II toxin-antitoxin system RelE/ParE family toxin [Rugamonas fusca]